MNFVKEIDSKVLNPKFKKLNILNRNYFYIATLAMIGILCLCFYVYKASIAHIIENNMFWNVFFMPLSSATIWQLVGNIIGFAFVSLLLERHFGSLRYFGIIILSFVPSSVATFGFSGSWVWNGFSGVLYFLYAIFILVLIFNARGYIFGKFRWIFPCIITLSMLLAMCWNGKADNWPTVVISFGPFTSLVENVGHWASMLMGGIFGLFAELCLRGVGVSRKKVVEENSKVKTKKTKKRKMQSLLKEKKVVSQGSQTAFAKAVIKKKS